MAIREHLSKMSMEKMVPSMKAVALTKGNGSGSAWEVDGENGNGHGFGQ